MSQSLGLGTSLRFGSGLSSLLMAVTVVAIPVTVLPLRLPRPTVALLWRLPVLVFALRLAVFAVLLAALAVSFQLLLLALCPPKRRIFLLILRPPTLRLPLVLPLALRPLRWLIDLPLRRRVLL